MIFNSSRILNKGCRIILGALVLFHEQEVCRTGEKMSNRGARADLTSGFLGVERQDGCGSGHDTDLSCRFTQSDTVSVKDTEQLLK
jgi:hypothetical protein